MDNSKKARELMKFLHPFIHLSVNEGQWAGMLVADLEAELNRLELPQAEKWEPRGGEWTVTINTGVLHANSNEECRLAGREYPTREEAEAAAPLHRKMDRLVNWMIQHCPDVEEKELIIAESVLGNISITFSGTPGKVFKDITNSGVVEL